MKKLMLLMFLLFPILALAQEGNINAPAPTGALTLGGIPKIIADKILEAKPAGIVDFQGHIGGGGYIPLYTFHDMAGKQYAELCNIGYRAIQAQKPSIMMMPLLLNITAISGRFWDFQWARDHVTHSHFPDLFLGPGVLLALDSAQVKQLRIDHPDEWLAFVASARF